MTTVQQSDVTPDVAVERCDVCVVGAGVAGLNALFVAGQYLSRDQKMILVDRRPRVGGMWVDTYPYVRLHQPHPMFTAGNIKWILGRDRAYLASKSEVLDHFAHCLDVIKQRVRVDEFFGWEVESHAEATGSRRHERPRPPSASRRSRFERTPRKPHPGFLLDAPPCVASSPVCPS